MKSQRQIIFEKFKGKCAYCGCEIHNGRMSKPNIQRMEIEHIIPKERFFRNMHNGFHIPDFLRHLTPDDVEHIDNKFPSCRTCNRYKHTLTLEDFRRELSKQLERAKTDSFNFRMALKYKQVIEQPKPIVFYFETQTFTLSNGVKWNKAI